MNVSVSGYNNLNIFYGDIHNHCGLSYGHGTLSDALNNARLQLDFVSITIHAVWPDLPTNDPQLNYLVDYHKQGFIKAQSNWNTYLKNIEAANDEGTFVTFPSFEWHSMNYGDYCVYFQHAAEAHIIDAPDLPSLRMMLRNISTPTMLIPHHIGYKRGFRGINWEAFSNEMSPVAEIFSFHGLSESTDGPYPYLHAMGPRHEQSTAHYGWAQGNVFGIVGSTDHHNSFPGSYGYGRMGVWAQSLSRESLWDAIYQRRTYALTGDNITLGFSVNGQPIGDICPADDQRWIEVEVRAIDSIDYIEVLHNNRVIHRESVLSDDEPDTVYHVCFEMGWAELDKPYNWNVELKIEDGQLLAVEPHIRGTDPRETPSDQEFSYTQLVHSGQNCYHIQTRTRQNPSLHSSATESVTLSIKGTSDTCIAAIFNDQYQSVKIGDLLTGSRTFYTAGFVSPAVSFHQAKPDHQLNRRFALSHRSLSSQRDWYAVRVRQRNNQWAWSSPIWVDGIPD